LSEAPLIEEDEGMDLGEEGMDLGEEFEEEDPDSFLKLTADGVPVSVDVRGTFATHDKDPNWHDVTGRRMLKHDTEGRMREPDKRPPTAQTFHSQMTDHQHDNMLSFLVDDRFFKGKEPMATKRAIADSILHKLPNKKGIKHKEPQIEGPDPKYSKEGGARLSEEKRRMEQNRILRHVTEEEFQRETERRMMLATIANPQKRLMLHRYFEEQRAIATRKIEALVRAQEHSMLIDMKLQADGPDLRGANFEKTYEPPTYFPLQYDVEGQRHRRRRGSRRGSQQSMSMESMRSMSMQSMSMESMSMSPGKQNHASPLGHE